MIPGVSNQQANILTSAAAQQNSKVQNAQLPSQYGCDQVTLSTAVAQAATSSKTTSLEDGRSLSANSAENNNRDTKKVNNQVVKQVSDEDKHKDNKDAYDLLHMASGLKGMLEGLIGVITKGQV